MKLITFPWERHPAAKIVAGSHSHKGDTSLSIEWRSAPYPASSEVANPENPVNPV
jgi:hypothetical protein